MKEHENRVQRREFLRQASCAALGATGVVSTLANLRLMSAAVAQAAAPTDYKALVCIFLAGGNDSNNFLVPIDGVPRAQYEQGRGFLALPAAELAPINDPGAASQFGFHGACPDLADLFNAGNLAAVANVGTLSYPIVNRADYLDGSVVVPPRLFSHADQQLQWQSSVPDKPFTSGWGGRIADLLNASYNVGSNVSMSISLGGQNNFQIGTNLASSQFSVPRNGISQLSGFGTDYASALNPDGTYKTTAKGWKLRGLDRILALTHENLHEDGYSRVFTRAREAEGILAAAMNEAAAIEADGAFTIDGLFTAAGGSSSLGDQLAQVARLVAGRGSLGNRRQVFFVSVGGFDTHQNELSSHAALLGELNGAIKGFWDSLVALGVQDSVTSFLASDFNRTLSPNGTDLTSGSDHAWGGHSVVFGGAVNGGRTYGTFPDLLIGDGRDAGSGRGRWIPTTAVDQYFAVLADWFGVDAQSMEAIFPNLGRFDDPFGATADLDFLAAV